MSAATHQASPAVTKDEAAGRRSGGGGRERASSSLLPARHLWPLVRKANRPHGHMHSADFDGHQPRWLGRARRRFVNTWPTAGRKQTDGAQPVSLWRLLLNQFWGHIVLAMATILFREAVIDNLLVLCCWRALSITLLLPSNPGSLPPPPPTHWNATTSNLQQHQQHLQHVQLYQEKWAQLVEQVCLIVALSFVHLFALVWHLNIVSHIAYNCRTCLVGLVYSKLLRVANPKHASQAINLMTRDIESLHVELQDLFVSYASPVAFLVAGYASITYLGAPISGMVLAANMALAAAGLPLVAGLKSAFKSYAQLADQRLSFFTDYLRGLQVLRMLAWTEHALKRIEEERAKEVRAKRQLVLVRVYNIFVYYLMSLMIVIITFWIAYFYLGLHLDSANIAMMIVVNIIYRRFFSHYLGSGITSSINLYSILIRTQNYLETLEVEPVQSRCPLLDSSSKLMLQLNQVLVSWPDNNDKQPVWSAALDLSLNQGELLIVGGNVGSGKSSLLQAIIGELPVISGSVALMANCRLSFAPQRAWVFSGTIRDNILFGSPMDRHRYARVLKVCALAQDLAAWERRDLVLVGERGVMLSGGQKARINLARCLYQEADLYVIDDPLSAVDGRVANQLFQEAIKGFLAHKTVILASHQHRLFGKADKILWLSKNGPSLSGTYQELKETLLPVDNHELVGASVDECLADAGQTEETIINSIVAAIQSSTTNQDLTTSPEGNLEYRLEKSHFWESMRFYLEQGGNRYDGLLLFLYESLIIWLQFGCWFWIIKWTVSNESSVSYGQTLQQASQSKHDSLTDVQVFKETAILVAFYICICILRFIRMYTVQVGSMKSIHSKLIKSVLTTDLHFHNCTPLGQLTCRISNDIEYLDLIFMGLYINVCLNLIPMVSICINTALQAPLFMVALVLYYLLVYYFLSLLSNLMNAANNVMNLRKSRVYSQVSITLDGLATIRAAQNQASFLRAFHLLQDEYDSSSYLVSYLYDFIRFLMTVSTLIFTLGNGVVFLSEVFHDQRLHVVMSINTFILFCRNNLYMCQRLLDFYLGSEALIRMKRFCQLRPEHVREPHEPPPLQLALLKSSSVEFVGVSMRYFRIGELVLRDVSFRVEAGEKVGIVGRSGSGKSSLIAALLRLYRFEGLVFIDGQDTKQLELASLRGCISCIPQEPTLFKGTIKSNLDPFGERSEAELWQALRTVQLSTIVAEMRDLLEAEVAELGANFSQGQKQLFCLARAILRPSKILILDEATASVDPKTDALIQETIRRQFVTSTVLSIAHRLSTVIDSDKIMVIDKGRLCEFGSPRQLLAANGLFTSMIRCSAEPLEAKILNDNSS